MVRSASMYYCSEAVKFLPDIDKIISFEVIFFSYFFKLFSLFKTKIY